MNPLLYILGLLLLATTPQATDTGHGTSREKSKWVILKSSNVSITGHTNVNHFSCAVDQYTTPDTLAFLEEGAKGQVPGIPLNGTLRLNVEQFDCRNPMMTDEFKKALQYCRYPQLVINFVNIEKMPSFSTQPQTVKGWVEISLAGTCKTFEIDYTASRSDRCSVQLTGTRQLAFHDFGLDPPRKMGGLIKVSDSLDVRFTLCLRQVE